MLSEIVVDDTLDQKPVRYRFHPAVRYFILALAALTAFYSAYFIIILIPSIQKFTIAFKLISIITLYVSLNSIYKHLTSLNSVIISKDSLELRFLLRKRIIIPWSSLIKMDIYKVITHYWKVIYRNNQGDTKTFKTSLAFPGIVQILLSIQDHKPDVELNDLLSKVLQFKRNTIPKPEETNPEA